MPGVRHHSLAVFADAELVELTEDLKEVFENWRTLTPEQKEAALTMMRAFNHDK